LPDSKHSGGRVKLPISIPEKRIVDKN